MEINTDSFNELLDRAYEHLENKTQINAKIKLPKFNINYYSTKLHWNNYQELCDAIIKSNNYNLLFDFLKKKITLYNVILEKFNDENKEKYYIIITGKNLKKNKIEDTLKLLIQNFIKEYIICPSCSSCDTHLNIIGRKKCEFICINCKMIKIITS
jgi:translation initiation factor 2 beta subunit (eIF-2beta)/eIF-5